LSEHMYAFTSTQCNPAWQLSLGIFPQACTLKLADTCFLCSRVSCCCCCCCRCCCCSPVFEDVYQAVVYGIEEQLTGEGWWWRGIAETGHACRHHHHVALVRSHSQASDDRHVTNSTQPSLTSSAASVCCLLSAAPPPPSHPKHTHSLCQLTFTPSLHTSPPHQVTCVRQC
jgi:hypothetical protein